MGGNSRIYHGPSRNNEGGGGYKLWVHCVKSVQITEFFLLRIFLYPVEIQENADQKKLRVWTLFTQWLRNGNLKWLTRLYTAEDWRNRLFLFTNLSYIFLREPFRVTAAKLLKQLHHPHNSRDLRKWIKHN